MSCAILQSIVDDFGQLISVHTLAHAVYMQRYDYFRGGV